MKPATLDRYLFWRCAWAAVAMIGLIALLVLGLDLLLRLADLTQGGLEDDESRGLLILRYLLYRLPTVVSPLLPVAAVGGALVALVPMLRRGELVALAAGGISLRRACRGAFFLAALLGLVDLVLSDQVSPRLQGPTARVEARLTGKPEVGRTWRVEASGATWFASRLWLASDGGNARDVAVADGKGRLLLARALIHTGDRGWVLEDTLEETPEAVVRHQRLPAEDWLALPWSPAELASRLASRHALTGSELWARGGRLNRSLALQRWLRLLAPLLCLACALPLVVRFELRDRPIQACSQGLLAAAVPLAILALGGAVSDSGQLSPGAILASTLLLAAAPGAWLMSRWRL